MNQYGLIFVEDLNVKGLAGGMLSKQVHDASWSSFMAKLAYKAVEAGRRLVKGRPEGDLATLPLRCSGAEETFETAEFVTQVLT